MRKDTIYKCRILFLLKYSFKNLCGVHYVKYTITGKYILKIKNWKKVPIKMVTSISSVYWTDYTNYV